MHQRKRRDRNRKRSKRRAIYCPEHGCYLDSVSQKHPLYAVSAEELRRRGLKRKDALMLVADRAAVPLVGEWLEAFWCVECQETCWYHVRRDTESGQYSLSVPPPNLWQQAAGVIHPEGNPSASEFSRRQARMSASKRISRSQAR